MTPEREAEIREYLAGIRYQPTKSEEMALELLSALRAERERADVAEKIERIHSANLTAAIERIATLEAALKAATEPRPIETAPRDGREFLARNGARWFTAWRHTPTGRFFNRVDNEIFPDAWLPLPTPPAGGAHD